MANKMFYLVMFWMFASSQYVPAQHSVSGDQKLVLAHYLPWFSDAEAQTGDPRPLRRHWIGERDDPYDASIHRYCTRPIIGEYDSADPKLIEYHVLLAHAAGVDGFSVNWYGENSYEDYATRVLFTTVADLNTRYPELNFALCISYDEQALTTDTSKNKIVEGTVTADSSMKADFLYLFTQYMNYSGPGGGNPYLYYQGKPVLFLYPETRMGETPAASAARNRDNWQQAVQHPAVLVWKNAADGVCNIMDSVYPWPQPANSENISPDNCWSDSTDWGGKEYYIPGDDSAKSYIKDYFWRLTHPGELCGGPADPIMGSVWPGLDDHCSFFPKAVGHNCRLMARDIPAGNVYNLSWEAMLHPSFGATCQWIQIVTWNDWNEGTQIEPDSSYFYHYLIQTAAYNAQFKEKTFKVDKECGPIYVPAYIYQARKVGQISAADAARHLYFSGEYEAAVLTALSANWFDDFSDPAKWTAPTNQYSCSLTSDGAAMTQTKTSILQACKMYTKALFAYDSTRDIMTLKIDCFKNAQSAVLVRVQMVSSYLEYDVMKIFPGQGPGIYSGSIRQALPGIATGDQFIISIWLEAGDDLEVTYDFISLSTRRYVFIPTPVEAGDFSVELAPEEAAGPSTTVYVYPNPFNAQTTIFYELSQAGVYRLTIFNLLGKVVYAQPEEHCDKGLHQLVWSGCDRQGIPVASGVYVIKLQSDWESISLKTAVVR